MKIQKGPELVNICDKCCYRAIDYYDTNFEVNRYAAKCRKMEEKLIHYVWDKYDTVLTPTWCPFLKDAS